MTRSHLLLVSLLALAACSSDSSSPRDEGSNDDNADSTGTDDSGDSTGTDDSDDSGDATDGDVDPDLGDGSGDSSGDTAIDAPPDVPTDVIEEFPITITLVNQNPRQSIYVQVSNGIGVPSWYGVFSANRTPLYIHDRCDFCNCPTTSCDPCSSTTASALELTPGNEITATWDAVVYELGEFRGRECENRVETTAGTPFYMQFCWTHDPPDANGVLPIADMSCTQVPFVAGDTEVFYDAN
jgi:hypothetical protein